MKKTLLSLMLPLCIFTAKAQITVTDADIGAVGTSIINLNDTTVTGTPIGSASSTSSTWNFSNLGIDTKDTINFISPSGTPAVSSFPNANLVLDNGENFTYVVKNTTSLAIDGIYGDYLNVGVNVSVNLSPNAQLIEFPSTYGNTFNGVSIIDSTVFNSFGVPFFDSLRVKRITDYDSEIDAFGDLTIPSGTYTTLRQYVQQTVTDTLWGFNSFSGWSIVSNTIETTHTYNWLANGEDYYILTATADAQNGNMTSASYQIGANLIASVTNIDVTCNGNSDGEATATAISGTGPFNYYWSNGATTQTISNLSAGTYTVTITDAVSTTATATAIVNEPIMLTISEDDFQDEIFGNDGFIDISVAGGTAPYSYAWSNGETTQDISNLVGDTYTVTVTDKNGCTETHSVTLAIATSVDEVNGKEELVVFPVPSKGVFNFSNSIEKVDVIDLSGRSILSREGRINSIDLSGYSEGVYFFKMQNDQDIVLKRVQIVR